MFPNSFRQSDSQTERVYVLLNDSSCFAFCCAYLLLRTNRLIHFYNLVIISHKYRSLYLFCLGEIINDQIIWAFTIKASCSNRGMELNKGDKSVNAIISVNQTFTWLTAPSTQVFVAQSFAAEVIQVELQLQSPLTFISHISCCVCIQTVALDMPRRRRFVE